MSTASGYRSSLPGGASENVGSNVISAADLADDNTVALHEEMYMRRLAMTAALLGTLFTGCNVVFRSGPAEPGPIAPVQFLRPVRDSITGTWVAAWVDPEGYEQSQTQE